MMSIVQGKNIRLSNCRYSNDSEELIYSTRKLEELLIKINEEAKQVISRGFSDVELENIIKLSEKFIENNCYSDDSDKMNVYKANVIKLQELQPVEANTLSFEFAIQ